MSFGQRGAFPCDGFVLSCSYGLLFVYRAKNGVRFGIGNFKQIGDRFVDSDIKIAVVVNAARECAAGRYFSGEECLRGAISENFFFVFQSGIAVPYGDGAYFSVRERGQRSRENISVNIAVLIDRAFFGRIRERDAVFCGKIKRVIADEWVLVQVNDDETMYLACKDCEGDDGKIKY